MFALNVLFKTTFIIHPFFFFKIWCLTVNINVIIPGSGRIFNRPPSPAAGFGWRYVFLCSRMLVIAFFSLEHFHSNKITNMSTKARSSRA
uniref:Uncharacterized protein n=1 Tax=Anguilla anguilla TaxID=7936 RepID=A0A0E9TWT8_ANGAN